MNASETGLRYQPMIWRTILCALMSWTVCLAQASEERVVFQSTDTPPFFSPSLANDGVAGEILHLVSERAGVDYAINYLPVKRFRSSESAYIVGDPDLLITRKHMAIFPIAVFRTALFYYQPRHPMSEFKGVAELSGHTLGVLHGTVEDKRYLASKGITVHESDTVESLLRMLKRGRVDYCILVHGTALHAITELFPQEQEQFVAKIIPGGERPIAIMIDLDAPDGARVAGRYRKVIEQTLAGRAYQDILEQYWGKSEVADELKRKLKDFVAIYSSSWEK